jgi:hypothetical protein
LIYTFSEAVISFQSTSFIEFSKLVYIKEEVKEKEKKRK